MGKDPVRTLILINCLSFKNYLRATLYTNVRMFNGRYLVDIREYYIDDAGERKPGRKGIALSLDQWEKLKAAVPEIDAKIHGD